MGKDGGTEGRGAGPGPGLVETARLYEAHRRIREIAEAYGRVNEEVHRITNEVKENWVGKGRNEFEFQYKILIRRIDDFGEALLDIYDALVEAQAQYETADDALRREFVKAVQS